MPDDDLIEIRSPTTGQTAKRSRQAYESFYKDKGYTVVGASAPADTNSVSTKEDPAVTLVTESGQRYPSMPLSRARAYASDHPGAEVELAAVKEDWGAAEAVRPFVQDVVRPLALGASEGFTSGSDKALTAMAGSAMTDLDLGEAYETAQQTQAQASEEHPVLHGVGNALGTGAQIYALARSAPAALAGRLGVSGGAPGVAKSAFQGVKALAGRNPALARFMAATGAGGAEAGLRAHSNQPVDQYSGADVAGEAMLGAELGGLAQIPAELLMRGGRSAMGYVRDDSTDLGTAVQQLEASGGELKGFGYKLPGEAESRRQLRSRRAVDEALLPPSERTARDVVKGAYAEAKRVAPGLAKKLKAYDDKAQASMGGTNARFYQSPVGQKREIPANTEAAIQQALESRTVRGTGAAGDDVAWDKGNKALRDAMSKLPGGRIEVAQKKYAPAVARLETRAKDLRQRLEKGVLFPDRVEAELARVEAELVPLRNALESGKMGHVLSHRHRKILDEMVGADETRRAELMAEMEQVEEDLAALGDIDQGYNAKEFDSAVRALESHIDFARRQGSKDPDLEQVHRAMMRDRAKWGDDWVQTKKRHAEKMGEIEDLYYSAGLRGMDINPEIMSDEMTDRIAQAMASGDMGRINRLAKTLDVDLSGPVSAAAGERISANAPRESFSRRGLSLHGGLHGAARVIDPVSKVVAKQERLGRTATLGRMIGSNAERIDAAAGGIPRPTMDFLLLQRRRAKENEDGTR